MGKMLGAQTVLLEMRPVVESWASAVCQKEGEGPLGSLFDVIYADDTLGQDNWEKAEMRLFLDAAERCIEKSGKTVEDVRMLLGGDLLNQLVASNFAGREMGLPFLGLFGACSTMAESLCVGAMILEGGSADRVVCAASSHFCTAERQFRFPLEMGTQRPPSAQWTVTGAGAAMLTARSAAPSAGSFLTHLTIGKPIDLGVTDASNMGAAMAPAAADTLHQHFMDTGRTPADYDMIVTGDLGMVGSAILRELMGEKGMPLKENRHEDCGLMIFSPEQDTHAGGSGCGCSASVLCASLLPRVSQGKIDRLLFMATGALMSTVSANEGESIPSIAHAVVIERPEGAKNNA